MKDLFHCRPEILRTNRGNKGGYMLAKEPSQYTVGQILRITEGGLTPVYWDSHHAAFFIYTA